jgi:anthranilate synthase
MAAVILEDGAESYTTKGGIVVTRRRREASYSDAIAGYVDRLDERRGAVFSSNYEYPGRYTRWGHRGGRPAACHLLLRSLALDRSL